jgi:hypothetical protein
METKDPGGKRTEFTLKYAFGCLWSLAYANLYDVYSLPQAGPDKRKLGTKNQKQIGFAY